jgi:hypothetical protein
MSNPMTGLIFVNELGAEDGGRLVFRPSGEREQAVQPKSGWFICFDARKVPHYVEKLKRNTFRASIPLNYYESATDQKRPADLDEYLYASASSQK